MIVAFYHRPWHLQREELNADDPTLAKGITFCKLCCRSWYEEGPQHFGSSFRGLKAKEQAGKEKAHTHKHITRAYLDVDAEKMVYVNWAMRGPHSHESYMLLYVDCIQNVLEKSMEHVQSQWQQENAKLDQNRVKCV
eukprot:1040059-Pelagomonas_calceolata.AAC.2